VDEFVPDDSHKQAYLQFAKEVALTIRRSSCELVIPRERGDSRNLSAMQSGRDPSQELGVTRRRDPSQELGVTEPRLERPRPFPDFSMRTKRVVLKYFRRGLHGNLLWRIGEAILRGR
jgi:hypothetical protein